MRAPREAVWDCGMVVGILPPYIDGAAPAARDRGQVEKTGSGLTQQVQWRSSALACKDRDGVVSSMPRLGGMTGVRQERKFAAGVSTAADRAETDIRKYCDARLDHLEERLVKACLWQINFGLSMP